MVTPISPNEEVVVTKDMLREVLETRIGGKSKRIGDLELGGDGHHVNSTDAIELGHDIWAHVHAAKGESSQPHFDFDEDKVQESLQARMV